MKNNRLLLIFAWFLIISCIVFTGENTSTPPATEPVTEEVTEEVAEPGLSPVLPTPLYFLSGEDGNASLWRIEVDGATHIKIKDCCIRDYAISPATGQIAYVTNETKLFISDAYGEEAIEVNLGEVSYPQELDTALAWSLDGLQLALGGENGLWVYMLESEKLFQISGTAEYTTFIRPLAFDAWSPDASKILIMAHKPTGRRATWAPDSESFYVSSNFYGMMGILPSLVVVSIDEMDPQALIKGEFTEEGHGRYLEGAQVGPDNLLYYFYGEGPIDLETKTTELSIYRSNRDGVADRVQLRTDTYFGISEILWTKDMSLAVIVIGGNFPNAHSGAINIVPTDGAIPAFETPFNGRGVQWGIAAK